MAITLYNTLTRKIELFVPLVPGKVGMYTCGPTVYGKPHIGNMRTYIFSDILKRTLLNAGFAVTHVMNITDVGHLTGDSDVGDDKVERMAREQRITAWDVAQQYTLIFEDYCRKLNIIPADIICRATDHIQQQIELVKILEAKGFTYRTSDGIYFDTSKLADYGKLARLQTDQLQAGKRVAMGEKRHPTDFALWKFSPKGAKRDMEWDSPWGVGFPGWHIECSAMSMAYLGETFDIHTGGIDHVPLHHTNEIAQSEAATGKPFVRYWLHAEFLVLDEAKRMGKSEGNAITLDTVQERGIDPLAYRYFCLSTHYRTQLTFTFEALQGAATALKRLQDNVREAYSPGAKPGKGTGYVERVRTAMDEDLNTPTAIAILWEAAKDASLTREERYGTLVAIDAFLGLGLADLKPVSIIVPAQIKALAEERQAMRKAKQWADADRLRAEIRQQGYDVVDTAEGFKIQKL